MSNRPFGSDDAPDFTTWDSEPVAGDPPHGVMVVCLRGSGPTAEVLVLHRAHNGVDYEGDWAWTPPSGARHPGELITVCARRELREETGIGLDPSPVDTDRDWAVFVAVVADSVQIALDCEHDRCEWVEFEEAVRRCRPHVVAEGVRLAVASTRPGGSHRE